jgi:hypothetical protein
LTLTFSILVAVPASAADAGPPLRDGYPTALEGLICKDAASGTIIYVETDGRHVAAISQAGKLLWRRDPFVDASMEPYRQAHPIISSIGPETDRASKRPNGKLAVRFTSSQFGEMDIATGKFVFEGQN